MKHLSIKSKIICVIILLVIIAGVAIVVTKGFNFDLKNQVSKKIELYIGKDFNISDIKQITNEVFENQEVILQKVEVYEDQVSITAYDITEEQKTKMVEKINEKYQTELKADDIDIDEIPHTKLRDIVKPYILPIVISTGVILLYSAIRFYKLGILKTIFKVGGILVIAELTLFAVMAISRFPLGRFTPPLVLFTYLVTMLGISTNLEKKLEEKLTSEKE